MGDSLSNRLWILIRLSKGMGFGSEKNGPFLMVRRSLSGTQQFNNQIFLYDDTLSNQFRKFPVIVHFVKQLINQC